MIAWFKNVSNPLSGVAAGPLLEELCGHAMDHFRFGFLWLQLIRVDAHGCHRQHHSKYQQNPFSRDSEHGFVVIS